MECSNFLFMISYACSLVLDLFFTVELQLFLLIEAWMKHGCLEENIDCSLKTSIALWNHFTYNLNIFGWILNLEYWKKTYPCHKGSFIIHYTPLRDHYTPLRDHYTPLRDQYTPLRDHTKYCLDTSTWSSFCTIRDPIILATSTVTKWVAIRLKKCMLCVHKTKINTNHAQRYVVIGSLFHKTHVKIDQNDHVWWRITYGEIAYGVRHLCICASQ